jgi:hypothetical protein
MYFTKLAQNFDEVTAQLLDKNMCSDVCPCYHHDKNLTDGYYTYI